MDRYRNKQIAPTSSSSARNDTAETKEASSPKSALSLSSVVRMRDCGGQIESNIIAVPGYRTPPVQTWNMKSELREAGFSVNSLSSLHMYIYQPGYEASDEFTWDSFLRVGSDLAEELARIATEFPNRPTIFVAHSLGGVLLKKALLLAHENIQDPRFKLVVECLSGILFLGTPHASVSDKDTLLRHNQVLYSCAKVAVHKQASRLPRHDVFQLANLAAAFEQIATIPILSVFEYDAPRSGVPKLFGKKSKALVDEQLATISSHAEQLLGVHLTHPELCKLPKLSDNSYSARDFLRFLLANFASNKRWSADAASLTSIQPSPADPLNPLNLAPIPSLRTQDVPSCVSKDIPVAQKRATGLSLHSPMPLHTMSNNSDTSSLCDLGTCRLPCFMVPQSRNPDFVGRTDILDRIDEHLHSSAPSARRQDQQTCFFALCGMGGIGKTDLAVEYAYSRRDKFDAIFWLEAGGVSQLASDFGRIPTQLGLQTAEEAESLESSIEIAKSWLANPFATEGGEACRWLLIFDNADNLDIITNYVPHQGNGAILVTSRDPFAKDHFFTNGSGIDLDPLPLDDGATLLHNLITKSDDSRSADEQEAAVELATHLDGLPLAVAQIAAFIRRRHLSIREFVSLYSNDARYAEIHNIGSPLQQRRYGYTLATAYSFQGLNANATRLLRVLAFLNPDRMQELIFVNANVPTTTNEPWTHSTFDDARYELLASSIVKRNIAKKELWIHRLMQAEVRTRMDDGDRYQTFNDAVALLSKVWPPGDHCSQKVQRWRLCEDLLPHLERFHQLFIEYSATWSQYDVDPALPTLLNEAAVYLHERGFSQEGKVYLSLALELCKRANITTEPLISDMHLNMGALSNETNDAVACLEHNIVCLEIRKSEAAKGRAPDLRLAFAYSQMGIAYMMIRKFALATAYFKQSVEMLKIIDGDPDDFGFPACNLGLSYWVQGDLDNADRTLKDLLAQREQLHGKLDTVSYKTGRVLQALGNVRAGKASRAEMEGDGLRAARLWDESLQFHKDCLQQYESTLGKFNHRTADACHKLAEHYIRQGKDVMAQSFLDRALKIWGDRPHYKNESARSSFLRGTHLISLGDEESVGKGRCWVERAKQLRREILPQEEPKKLQHADFDDLVCFWSI